MPSYVLWTDKRYGLSFMGKRIARDNGLVAYLHERFEALACSLESEEVLGPCLREGDPYFVEIDFSWPSEGLVHIFRFDKLYPADVFVDVSGHQLLESETLTVGSFHTVIVHEVWR